MAGVRVGLLVPLTRVPYSLSSDFSVSHKQEFLQGLSFPLLDGCSLKKYSHTHVLEAADGNQSPSPCLQCIS